MLGKIKSTMESKTKKDGPDKDDDRAEKAKPTNSPWPVQNKNPLIDMKLTRLISRKNKKVGFSPFGLRNSLCQTILCP